MSLRIDIITPFPDMVTAVVGTSILGRAVEGGLVDLHLHNLYEYAAEPHHKIDDEPYGGGAGMVLRPEPVFRAFDAVLKAAGPDAAPRVVYPTPDSRPFTQSDAESLARSPHLVFIAGHYKGVDQRVRETLVTDEYSVGDFVVTGGELPALLMLDAVVRLQEGALHDPESARSDSFSSNLLDYPHYTRPREYRGATVPEVLLSGDHGKIAAWRQERREARTRERRPDIWRTYISTAGDTVGDRRG